MNIKGKGLPDMTIFKTDEKTVPMVELFGLEKDELNEFMNSAFIPAFSET